MAAYLKKLQWFLVFQFALTSFILIGTWIDLRWGGGKASSLIGPFSLLFTAVLLTAMYALGSRSAVLVENAALETRLTALEVELNELKATQTNASPIGNDPV